MDEINQSVIIKNRRALSAEGITDVEGLADDYLALNTEYGKMYVEGKGLKIKELSESNGKLDISGEITGVFFKEENGSKKGIKKIFK